MNIFRYLSLSCSWKYFKAPSTSFALKAVHNWLITSSILAFCTAKSGGCCSDISGGGIVGVVAADTDPVTGGKELVTGGCWPEFTGKGAGAKETAGALGSVAMSPVSAGGAGIVTGGKAVAADEVWPGTTSDGASRATMSITPTSPWTIAMPIPVNSIYRATPALRSLLASHAARPPTQDKNTGNNHHAGLTALPSGLAAARTGIDCVTVLLVVNSFSTQGGQYDLPSISDWQARHISLPQQTHDPTASLLA